MSVTNIKFLYRFIIRRGKHYCIFKDGVRYNTFHTLENAMLERDLLEWCDWNESLVEHLGTDIPNPYKKIDLPKFPKDRNSINRIPYVTVTERGRYRVQKMINGSLSTFGSFNTKREATAIVKKLQANDWNDDFDGKKQVKLI